MRRLAPLVLVAFASVARADLKIPGSAGASGAACVQAPGARVVAAFPHGPGRAAPNAEPLDEERAMVVVETELRAAGLAPERGRLRLATVTQDAVSHAYHQGEGGRHYCIEGHANVAQIVHGFDARAGVGYLFVTAGHAARMTIAGVPARTLPGLAEIAAAVARAAAAEERPRHLGVFYDPLVVEACEGKACHALAEELLRAQVRDFIACLRAAGAIGHT